MAENLELSLLCTETNVLVDDEDKGIVVDKTPIEISIPQMGFFQSEESEEIIREMVEKEKQHLPSDDYIKRLRSGDLDLNVRRREALNWIWKACEEHQFGPLCFCLSMNYLDRFLSVHDLPSGKVWILQLLAVACLSLAAKIEETEVPTLIDLQVGDPQYVFEAKSVQRMELLVLNRLKWRLRAITPCSYIRYFLRKMSKCDQEPSNTLISRSLQVIASTTKGEKGIDFLEFRPSEVAAAVALSVSGELHTVHFDNSSFSPLFSLLQKEKVKEIGEMIESDGSGLCSQTPNGVLEVSACCFSFKAHDSSSSPHTHLS
ncbi:PREDICTED: cyclin-D4-1-like isoform X1 [Camelina sativa]|uniref:Cyclin-D4-1-like isoform X1 n=1 Tax=Camelina sativa TaxID=90675 RepID=A0ABM0UQF4_CAMSA|nr:PREDICTED: cyclin-D4-1-like isoform X1 [Camelina sativa]